MNVNATVKFSTEQEPWLCFRHAVEAAINGASIDVDIDDFGSEYYSGPTYCSRCSERP